MAKAHIQYESDLLSVDELHEIEKKAVKQTVKELIDITGSIIVTDGEQTKASFLTYPINDSVYDHYKFDDKCFQMIYSDGK